MIRKSNRSRVELIGAVGRSVQAFQDATDQFDEAAAAHLQLNRTGLRCLSVLAQAGLTTASALAEAAGLSRGAMTAALDGLEAAGFVRRVRGTEDRRMVQVEMTTAARKRVEALYGPLASEGFERLQAYATPELEAVLRYLGEGRELQLAHAQRIRASTGPRRRASRGPASSDRSGMKGSETPE